MDLTETIRVAGRSLRGHRLRTALTIVGIVIGIGTVVTFASFGFSVQGSVTDEFEETSANEIVITESTGIEFGDPPEDFDGPPENGFGDFDLETQPILTDRDAQSLRELPDTTAVISQGSVSDIGGIVAYNEHNVSVRTGLTAVSANFFDSRTFSTGTAYEPGADEIVLSESAAAELAEVADTQPTTGDTLTVATLAGDQHTLTVTGIIEDDDDGAFIPGTAGGGYYISTEHSLYDGSVSLPGEQAERLAYEQLTVTAPADDVSAVQVAVEEYLTEESDAAAVVGADNISVTSSLDIIEGVESVLTDITRFVTGIGLLALLVGAFGIANIMLVSVTERTNEIGIMKAVGATNRDVMRLFLVESIMLGAAGALIGIPVGLGVGYVASTYAEVAFVIPVGWVGAAAAMGIAIGIVAGVYPAWRATRVDPIEALRYE